MNYTAKDLMMPFSEYATIPEGSTLFEAVLALENTKIEHGGAFYSHWMVLVMGKDGKVLGKLSQLDILRALAPRDKFTDKLDEMGKFGFSSNFISTMREQYRMQKTSLESGLMLSALIHLYPEEYQTHKSSLEEFYAQPGTLNMKVEDFMKTIAENEFVDENTSLDTAAHMMFMKNRLSLLVTREDRFIGVLRLSDVFSAVLNTMKEAVSEEKAI
ncbi:MAG: CBS domain-containing protein [Desulfocapsaceae bacterium]|nr:CBS domain-containing protein [Desulfocapsaceae bacterium]